MQIYNDPAEFERLTGVKGGVFGASYHGTSLAIQARNIT